jgi:hypothetical protein
MCIAISDHRLPDMAFERISALPRAAPERHVVFSFRQIIQEQSQQNVMEGSEDTARLAHDALKPVADTGLRDETEYRPKVVHIGISQT